MTVERAYRTTRMFGPKKSTVHALRDDADEPVTLCGLSGGVWNGCDPYELTDPADIPVRVTDCARCASTLRRLLAVP